MDLQGFLKLFGNLFFSKYPWSEMKIINYTTDESQAGIVYRMPTHPTDNP